MRLRQNLVGDYDAFQQDIFFKPFRLPRPNGIGLQGPSNLVLLLSLVSSAPQCGGAVVFAMRLQRVARAQEV